MSRSRRIGLYGRDSHMDSTEHLNVKSEIDIKSITSQLSDTLYNVITDQIQELVDICLMYGIDKESMKKIIKEYSARTSIKGIKIRKSKGLPFITNMEASFGDFQRTPQENKDSSIFFPDKEQTEDDIEVGILSVEEEEVRYITNLKFSDGACPVLNLEGHVYLAVVIEEDGKYTSRDLLEDDVKLLQEYNISYIHSLPLQEEEEIEDNRE